RKPQPPPDPGSAQEPFGSWPVERIPVLPAHPFGDVFPAAKWERCSAPGPNLWRLKLGGPSHSLPGGKRISGNPTRPASESPLPKSEMSSNFGLRISNFEFRISSPGESSLPLFFLFTGLPVLGLGL